MHWRDRMIPAAVVVPMLPPLPAASVVLLVLAVLAAGGALAVLGAVVRQELAARRTVAAIAPAPAIPAAAWH